MIVGYAVYLVERNENDILLSWVAVSKIVATLDQALAIADHSGPMAEIATMVQGLGIITPNFA